MSDSLKSLLNNPIASIPEIHEKRGNSQDRASCAAPRSTTSPLLPGGVEVKAGPDSIKLDDIFARLWHRRRAIVSMAAAGLAAGLFFTAVRTPVYRARTAIRLEGPGDRSQNLADIFPLSSIGASASGEAYLQNEVKVLESETLARRVANRLEMETSAQSSAPAAPTAPFSRLLARVSRGRRSLTADDMRTAAVARALTVRSSLKSQVVEIFFDSTDANRAASGANLVVAEYVAINREAQQNVAHDTTAWLAEQISDLKTKLDKENDQLQEFAASSGLLYSTNQGSLTEQRVREIQEQLSKAQADRAAKQSRYEAAISNSPESLPDNSENSLLREYDANLAAAQRDLIQFRSMFTPQHYKVIDAEARVAQLEAAIREERKNIIERIRAEYDSSLRYERSLESSYGAQTRKLESQTADTFRYNVAKRELENTQQLYDSLLHKAKEAGITSALHATSIRVIDSARPPTAPYSPNLPLNCAVGLAGGLLVAVATVLIRDSHLIERSEESRILSIRELGAIPAAKHDPLLGAGRTALLTAGRREPTPIETVTWHSQRSLLSESYRSAITSILFSADRERRPAVLTVTSAQAEEGKTTTVINLGIALAESHGRVLLVDADLRRPGLHRIFDHCNDTGLTTLLAGTGPITDLREFAHPTHIPRLSIVPSGPGCASVSPLLHSTRMAAFLDRAREEFEFVLIDTPPAMLFSDSRILGRHSDSVIVVFRADKTSRGALNSVCLQFVDDGINVLGIIRNSSAFTSGPLTSAYYGYGGA
jgi:capsular exopolysaccharide synthesis family protein